jgi:hypothetical protein
MVVGGFTTVSVLLGTDLAETCTDSVEFASVE